MKTKLNYALLVASLGAIPLSTYAADITWDGSTDGDWADGTNWVGDTAPVGGDKLIFTGSTSLTTNNDLTAGTSIGGILFDDSVSASGDFTLAGNDIVLGAAIESASTGTVTNTVDLNMSITANKGIYADDGNTLIITGDISGTGSILTNQGGTYEGEVVLSGNNSYTGLTRTQGGTLRITTSDSLGNGLIDIRDSGAVLPIVILDATAGDLTFTNGVRFHNTGNEKILSVIGGNATISGGFQLVDAGADDGSIAVTLNNTLTLSGVISGAGILNIDSDRTADGRTVNGGGTVVLQGDNTHTGGNLLEEGFLRLEHDNALGTGALTVEDRGTNPIVILGDGVTINNDLIIAAQGGNKRLQLFGGTANEATWSGNITVNETQANQFDLASNSTGGDNSLDQILTVSGVITSTAGAGLEIMNDGVVRLTGDNNISDTINISNNGSKLLVGHNNALGGAGGANVLISNENTTLSIEDGISTNAANGLTVGSNNGNKVLEIENASEVAESATFGGGIIINEDVAGNFDVNVTDALDTLTLAGVVSGTAAGGLTKTGAGTVILTNDNTYTSITDISAGTLQVGNGGTTGTLGTGDVTNSGELVFNRSDANTVANNFSGSGQYTQSGTGTTTLTGTLQLSSAQQQFNVTTNGDTSPELIINSNISNDGSNRDLRKTGDGTLLLTGTNDYFRTRINSGVLQIEEVGNLGSSSVFISDSTIEGVLEFVGGSDSTITSAVQHRGNAGVNATIRANGAGAVTLSTFSNSGNGNTLILDGSSTALNTIAADLDDLGDASLTKAGTGTWVISADQTYAGTTSITGGILQIGNGGTAGTLGAGAGAIANAGTLDINRSDAYTVANVISGTGAVTQSGAGTTTLTGTNTYTGITTIDAGILQIGNGSTTGTLGTGAVANSGEVVFNRSDANTVANDFSGTGEYTQSGAGTTTLSGAIQLGTAQQQFNVNTDLVISGDIGADGERDLIKNGTGTLLLTGDNSAGAVVIAGVGDADFDGINRVRIKQGIVQIQQANNLGDNSIFISDGANDGTLEFVGSSATTIENEISLRGNAGTNTTLRASGTTSAAAVEYSYGNLGGNGDTLTLDGANTGLNTIGFDLNTNGNLLAGGLTKDGAGTWVLKTGVSQTYTGTTTVSAGTLIIDGDSSQATGAVTVASGATLGGSGTIGGATTISAGGFLNPGNSPGLMTFAGDLTLAGTTTMEIDGAGRGTGYDAIDVGGLLTYGGDLVITADTAIAAGTYDLFGIDGTEGSDFASIVLSGLAYSNDALTFDLSDVWTATIGLTTFAFTQSTGDLIVTIVPEPGTFALIAGMFALSSIAMRRRRA